MDLHVATPFVHTTRRALYSEGDKARAIRHAILLGRDIHQALPVVYGGEVVGATLGYPGKAYARFLPLTQKQWCGFKGYNELYQAVKNNQVGHGFRFNKTDISSTIAGFKDYWPVGVSPASGTYAGAAATARQCNDQTVGALQYHFTPGGSKTQHVYQYTFNGNVQGFLLYDRVLVYDNEVISTTTTTMTNLLTAQRYIAAGQPGLCIMVTGTTGTAIGATASTLTTMTYVDNAGNPGITVPTDTTLNWKTTVPAAGLTNGANVILPETVAPVYSPFLPLAPGDTGVQSITDYTSSANNTGQVCIALVRPFGWLMFTSSGTSHRVDFGRNFMALDRIFDGACLSMIVSSGGQNSFGVDVKTVWG